MSESAQNPGFGSATAEHAEKGKGKAPEDPTAQMSEEDDDDDDEEEVVETDCHSIHRS